MPSKKVIFSKPATKKQVIRYFLETEDYDMSIYIPKALLKELSAEAVPETVMVTFDTLE